MNKILLVSIAAFGEILGAAGSGFALRCQQKQKQLLTAREGLQYMKKVEKIHLWRVSQRD